MSKPTITSRMLRARGHYRRLLAADPNLSTLSLAGLAPDDEPILLREIYVPLLLTEDRMDGDEPESRRSAGGQPLENWLCQVKETMQRCFFVSGEAGSGKTTLTRSIVMSLADSHGDSFNRRLKGYVPFPILLREAPINELESLDALVDWWLVEVQSRDSDAHEMLDGEALTAFLDQGKAILILDGLDEVGTLQRRRKVVRWLRGHRWVEPGSPKSLPNFTVVTARPSGFQDLSEDELSGVRSLQVAPFSAEQIREYLTRWFALRPLPPQRRMENVDELVERLTGRAERERLRPLSQRPAYLAALAFVHGTRGALPQTRAPLYEMLVDAYLDALDRHRGLEEARREEGLPVWDRQEKLEVLSAVAYQAHVGGGERRGLHRDRRLLWTYDELQEAVRQGIAWGEARFRDLRQQHAADLTKYLVARTGLLVAAKEGLYQFAHLSLQEYLTALFILNQSAGNAKRLAGVLFPLLAESGWQEVALLVLAIDAERTRGQGHQELLSLLNLDSVGPLSFLGAVLREPELRLTREERKGWFLLWLAGWAKAERESSPVQVLGARQNKEWVQEAWGAFYQGTMAGLGPIGSLQEHFRTATGGQREAEDDPFSLMAGPTPQTEDSEQGVLPLPLERFMQATEAEEVDLAQERLLSLPAVAGLNLPGSEEQILELSEKLNPAVGSGPWWAIFWWIPKSPAVGANLAQNARLLSWLAFEELPLALGLEEVTDSLEGLAKWRYRVWQSWSCSLAVSWGIWMGCELESLRSTGEPLPPDSPFEETRRLSLSLSRSLSQSRSQSRSWPLSQSRLWSLSRSRLLSRSRSLSLSLDLSRSQSRFRSLSQSLDLSLSLSRSRSLSQSLSLSRSLWKVLSPERAEFRREDPAQQEGLLFRLFFGLSRFFAENLASVSLVKEDQIVQRAEVKKMVDRFRHPAQMSASLPSALRKEAAAEWREVLESPSNPIPFLESALRVDWEVIDLSPRAVSQRLEEELEAVIGELKVREAESE